MHGSVLGLQLVSLANPYQITMLEKCLVFSPPQVCRSRDSLLTCHMIIECKESIEVVCKSRSVLLTVENSAVEVRCRLELALKPGVSRQQAGLGSAEVF